MMQIGVDGLRRQLTAILADRMSRIILVVLLVLLGLFAYSAWDQRRRREGERVEREVAAAARKAEEARLAAAMEKRGKTFEKVHRTARAVEGATAVGVTYREFANLVQQFATELLVVREQLTDSDGEGCQECLRVLEVYKDSLSLWRRKVEGGSGISDQIAREANLIFFWGDAEATSVIRKYGIPTVRDEFVSPDAISVIWTLAKGRCT
jgi:hypothetical protein